MQITIPSIVRAVQNRPRPDWKDEEQEECQEPAAVVVNHIANKHIEHLEQRRAAQNQQVEQTEESDKTDVDKVAEMIREIEFDVF